MASVTTQFQKRQISIVRSQQDQKRTPPRPPAIGFGHTSLSVFLEKLSLSLYEAPLGITGLITQA